MTGQRRLYGSKSANSPDATKMMAVPYRTYFSGSRLPMSIQTTAASASEVGSPGVLPSQT